MTPSSPRSSVLGGLLLLAALLAAPAQADLAEAVRRFDEGNRLYGEGDYEAAVAAYEAALGAGYASGALYYNLGNAYYRLDALGQAVRYYEKARRLLPGDPNIEHNLEIVRSRTLDQFTQIPEPFWTRAWRWLVARFGAGWLFGVGLALYLTAAALLGLRVWTGSANPWLRRGLSAAAAAAVVFLAVGFVASATHRSDARAVVVAEQAGLFAEPRPDAAQEMDLHEGALLDVLAREAQWLRVRLPNGTTGWIDSAATAEI